MSTQHRLQASHPGRATPRQRNAQRCAQPLGQQVVDGNRARRKVQLRELDRHSKHKPKAERQHTAEEAPPDPFTCQRSSGQKTHGHIQHPVGDPVGSAFEADVEHGNVRETRQRFLQRNMAKLQRDQTAVHDEQDPHPPERLHHPQAPRSVVLWEDCGADHAKMIVAGPRSHCLARLTDPIRDNRPDRSLLASPTPPTPPRTACST